jgi:hypothetical protein
MADSKMQTPRYGTVQILLSPQSSRPVSYFSFLVGKTNKHVEEILKLISSVKTKTSTYSKPRRALGNSYQVLQNCTYCVLHVFEL